MSSDGGVKALNGAGGNGQPQTRLPDMSFNFASSGSAPSENSLGNYLQAFYGNSSGNVSEEIRQHFDNPSLLSKPLELQKPVYSTSGKSGANDNYQPIPKEFVVPVKKSRSSVSEDGKALSDNSDNNKASSIPSPVFSQSSQSQAPVPLPVTALPERNLSIISSLPDNGAQYCDITEYLTMPQAEAAKKLSIPPSTLSKRWKEAVRNRKWPWRTVCKVDKEITTLLHNIPPGGSIPEEIEQSLTRLLRQRQEELRPVVIRMG